MDEWYNAIQAQVNLAKYPPETAKILHYDIFCFFLKDEDFVTKTINEGNVNIQKFPASRVQQLAKKMESSKAMANLTGCWGPASSTNTTDATSMHPTSCQELSQEETDNNWKAETAKPQDPRNSHILETL